MIYLVFNCVSPRRVLDFSELVKKEERKHSSQREVAKANEAFACATRDEEYIVMINASADGTSNACDDSQDVKGRCTSKYIRNHGNGEAHHPDQAISMEHLCDTTC